VATTHTEPTPTRLRSLTAKPFPPVGLRNLHGHNAEENGSDSSCPGAGGGSGSEDDGSRESECDGQTCEGEPSSEGDSDFRLREEERLANLHLTEARGNRDGEPPSASGGMFFELREELGGIRKPYNITRNPKRGLGFMFTDLVVSHVVGGSASDSKVRIGSRLTHVEGRSVAGMNDDDVRQMIASYIPKDCSITFTIEPPEKGIGQRRGFTTATKAATRIEDWEDKWGRMQSDGENEIPTGLPEAALQHQTVEIRDKLGRGADPLEENSVGWTALHIACFKGYTDIVKAIVNRNPALVNVTLKDGGASPLYLACQQGHAKTAIYLMKQNASKEYETYVGSTPLYVAAQGGHFDCVFSLLEAGADPNHVCKSRGTAARIAAELMRKPILRLLVRYGADLSVNAKELGISPYEIITKKYKVEFSRVIKDPFERARALAIMQYHEEERVKAALDRENKANEENSKSSEDMVSAPANITVEPWLLAPSIQSLSAWDSTSSENPDEMNRVRTAKPDRFNSDSEYSNENNCEESQTGTELEVEEYLANPQGTPPMKVIAGHDLDM